MTPEDAEARQRAYERRRKRWARSIGIPYARDHDLEPDPAVLDATDPEDG